MGGPRLIIPLIVVAALATLVLSIVFTNLRAIHWGFWFYLALFVVAAQFDVEVKGGGVVNLGLAPLLAALVSIPVAMGPVRYAGADTLSRLYGFSCSGLSSR